MVRALSFGHQPGVRPLKIKKHFSTEESLDQRIERSSTPQVLWLVPTQRRLFGQLGESRPPRMDTLHSFSEQKFSLEMALVGSRYGPSVRD